MEIKYNVTGARRKELVKVISDTTGARAEYKFMPTCNYEIDYFTVTKDGTLLFDDMADTEEVEQVLIAIANAGFECEAADSAAQEGDTAEKTAAPDTSAEDGSAAQDANVGLTVRIPLDKVAVGNLTRLLEVKGSLIKNALGIADLPITIEEDAVAFPWFEELPSADEVNAYTHLISALCEMSKNQKRIPATRWQKKRKRTTTSTHSAASFSAWASSEPSSRPSGRSCSETSPAPPLSRAVTKEVRTMPFPPKKIVERLRREFPIGTRVQLVKMDDVQAPPVGTLGTVQGVDDIGSILVAWDTGSGLSVAYGEDLCRKVASTSGGSKQP